MSQTSPFKRPRALGLRYSSIRLPRRQQVASSNWFIRFLLFLRLPQLASQRLHLFRNRGSLLLAHLTISPLNRHPRTLLETFLVPHVRNVLYS